MDMAQKVDPTATEILDEKLNLQNKCIDYGRNCVRGFGAKIRGLEMVFIEFESESDARQEAIRIDGYYKYNWVMDDITGEPMLERFVVKVYGATRPRLELEKAEKAEN